MNDLNRLLEDATPEPAPGLSVDAVLAAARRRQRLRAGAVGLALALVVGGVGTAFAVTRDSGSQVLQPAETPAPVPSPASSPTPSTTPDTSTVQVGVRGGFASCINVVLVPRVVPGPPTVGAALKSLFSGLTPAEAATGRFTSAFSPATAGLLQGVQTRDGITVIDLGGAVRNLVQDPSSCEPQQLSAVVNRTLDAYRPYVITVDGDESQGASLFGGAGSPRTTVRVALSGPGSDTCGETTTVVRPVEGLPDASAALTALFAATPNLVEKERGLSSSFDARTEGLLRSVHVVDGVAYVDLNDFRGLRLPVGTTCGTTAFLAQIEATLAPFGAVGDARIAIEGDPAAAQDVFQVGCPEPVKVGDPCDPAPFATPSPFSTVGLAFVADGDPGGVGATRVTERDVLGPPTAAEALELLFAGPTEAEREQGLSGVGPSTAGLLRSVHQRGSTYYVDLHAEVAAGYPCLTAEGCVTFGGPVRATLAGLGPVETVLYALDGDPRRLVDAIGLGACAEPGGPPPGAESGTYDCDPALFRD